MYNLYVCIWTDHYVAGSTKDKRVGFLEFRELPNLLCICRNELLPTVCSYNNDGLSRCDWPCRVTRRYGVTENGLNLESGVS